jgi:tetratricopeptide (TPR) repeat protein
VSADPAQEQQLAHVLRRIDEAVGREDSEAVLQIVPEALAIDPRQVDAHLAKALAYASLKDRAGFLRAVDEGSVALEAPYVFTSLKSLGLSILGDSDTAIEIAEALRTEMPTDPEPWYLIGFARMNNGEGDVALAAAEKALELGPENSPDHLRLIWQTASAAENYGRGLEATKAALGLDPSNLGALVFEVFFLTNLQLLDEAAEAAERAYAVDPKAPEVLRCKATIAGMREEWTSSRETIDAWLAQKPSSAPAWATLGMVEVSQENWEQAIAAGRRALEIDPDFTDAKRVLATGLLGVGSLPEALSIYADLAVSAPDDEFIWLGKSVAERLSGQTEVAIDTALGALRAGKFKSAAGWVTLAHAYSAAGRHANAWRAFELAKGLDGDLYEAALGIAVESISCHREMRALTELDEAEARVGSHGLIEYNRGVAHYKLGNQALARGAWERARNLNPELGATDVLLRAVQREKGQANWSDYWLGEGVGGLRKLAGAVLLLALVVSLTIPFLRPHLISGVVTGRLNVQAFLPAAFLGLLIVWPAIRGLKVGPVSLDVSPISPEEKLKFDPSQVLPAFEYEEIDISRLVPR